MSINYDKNYEEQLREMSDILELINYRPRTIESYLRSISECCDWLGSTFGISIDEATVSQLRSFLVYLHRPASDGGREFKPRSVNIYNCAIKKYFRYVLRKDLSNRDLPTMRVDNPLPRVPSQNFDYLSLTSASVNCQAREHHQAYAA
jgi:site-specific recombinase XerD